MSRIDEGRRRTAREAPIVKSRGETVRQPLDGDDIIALAAEELANEPRRTLPADLLHHPEPAPSPGRHRVLAATTLERIAASERPSSLFERIDTGVVGKTVIDESMLSTPREEYRRLAALLHDAQREKQLQVVMIASAVAGEGKTLTATNLALTLSESYQKRVLLVDADLRRPMLDALFSLDSAHGLSDGLMPGVHSKLVFRQVSPHLAVLPAGRPKEDPMALLTSERMRRVLDEARERFDWVILDTPPLVLLPDAHLLASMVDGAVIVIRAEATPHALIKRAADAIGRTRILGAVLNRAQTAVSGYKS